MYRTIISRSRNTSLGCWAVAWPRGYITIACLLLGITVCFSGCKALSSSEDETDLEPGTFSVQVEGYVNQSFEGGEAVFGTTRSQPEYFFLKLQFPGTDEVQHYVRFVNGGYKDGTPVKGARPDIGTYELANVGTPDTQGDPTQYRGFYDYLEISENFDSKGGTLTITESSEEMLKGSFDFSASDSVYNSQGESEEIEVQVTGTFHAVQGPVSVDTF